MGSIIGALALEDGAVTDVGLDVSAKHLRIFAENNAWYAQDLGSTNGTHLIRTADNSELDISSRRTRPAVPRRHPAPGSQHFFCRRSNGGYLSKSTSLTMEAGGL